MCHLSGDTSQCLAHTVLLGDKKCCLTDRQLSAGVRICRRHKSRPLAPGRVGSDDGAIALQRQAPLCLLHPEWCDTLTKLELLINVLDADVRI